MFVREGIRNWANGRRCHLSVCVCRSGGKINTRHWNWFCHLCGECEHVLLVSECCFFSLCCFALLSTSSPNLSWLPLTSAGFTPHHPLLCPCSRCASWGSNKDKQEKIAPVLQNQTHTEELGQNGCQRCQLSWLNLRLGFILHCMWLCVWIWARVHVATALYFSHCAGI